MNIPVANCEDGSAVTKIIYASNWIVLKWEIKSKLKILYSTGKSLIKIQLNSKIQNIIYNFQKHGTGNISSL